MLCRRCRRRLARDAVRCRCCGARTGRGAETLELQLPDGRRVPVEGRMTIGRGAASDVRLSDPTVSGHHATVLPGPALADAGSRYGTFLDGRRLTSNTPLRVGMRVGVGDVELRVVAAVPAESAAPTLSVPVVASGVWSSVAGAGPAPRLRSGWALKRLEAGEGPRRHVLKDLRGGAFVRLGEPQAELLELLDGRRDLPVLVAESERRLGAAGPGHLAGLLSELADRGLLSGLSAAGGDSVQPGAGDGRLRRLARSREWTPAGVPALLGRGYRAGGWLLFTRVAAALLGLLGTAGLVAFALVIAGRRGTPFVVGGRLGLGALVFVLARLLIVAAHELAHGLAAECCGRPVSRAGVKTVLWFPYAFVDTSDAWFEPRRRRIAISLAGPASDLILGGGFALACALTPAGSVRDVLLQLAIAGYVGALFNLNPLLDRDGYHVLSDLLRQPSLRRRAREQLTARLAGRPAPGRTPALLPYAVASLAWSALTVAFAVALSLRYYSRLLALAPEPLVWTVLAAFYLVLALPLTYQLVRPLWERARRRDEAIGV